MLYRPTENESRWRYASAGIHAALRAVADRLVHWAGISDDIKKLRAFDDRLLADMGLERPEIAARVKGRRPAGPAGRSR